MADSLDAQVSGASQVAAAIRSVLEGLPGAVQVALLAEGASIAASAVQRCPMQTGALRRSVYVRPAPERGVVVGFSAPYALAVHERTDVSHGRGEPKFLQRSLDAHASGLAGRVARATVVTR
jgi:hypothetical protein